MKVFLSHASEDKKLVEQILIRIQNQFPDIQGWLDKYEIFAGDDLIEKIYSGISQSDKFLIFLSPNSVDKPWVRTELRKALFDEIAGIKPEFIIPVKLGHISQFPPFLESRFYVDIENKTEDEWLQDIYAAISRTKKPLADATENLRVTAHIAADNPKAAMLVFEALFWSEPISFKVTTLAEARSTVWQLPGLQGMHQVSIAEYKSKRQYGVRIQDKVIRPKAPFVVGLEFDEAGDPIQYISGVEKWDGSGGESSLRFIDFK
jgi:hypothetical protein